MNNQTNDKETFGFPPDHQSAATPPQAPSPSGRERDDGTAQAVTGGPAVDPIADLCRRLRDELSGERDRHKRTHERAERVNAQFRAMED